MPELPEVETVRKGLSESVLGAQIESARIRHSRVIRRHDAGRQDFINCVTGTEISNVHRRGKFLWLELAFDEQPDFALVAHLGMSGQFRLSTKQRVVDRHARATFRLADGRTLVFRDQRTFGWLLAVDWDGAEVPEPVRHIALDPFDPSYRRDQVAVAMARSNSGIKRLLLSQHLVSGVGNIYADEALWRAGIHPDTSGRVLAVQGCTQVLEEATSVMTAALEAGGTSFDPLYVSVNGESGWFDRSLDAYGREGLPCRRCGQAIVRERFTNRSSHRCPSCQPPPFEHEAFQVRDEVAQ